MEKAVSLKTIVQTIPTRWRELLLKDISHVSRQKRRARECARRGIPLSRIEGRGDGASKKEHYCIMEGELTNGLSSLFAVGEDDFNIDENTQILGELEVGNVVTITAIIKEDGERYAEKILVRKL
jgi:hypothetical protein